MDRDIPYEIRLLLPRVVDLGAIKKRCMALIKSISGMRGTIGGKPGENLTPVDIVEFAAAYAKWILSQHSSPTVVIGRDGRISGSQVQALVVNTLIMSGVNIIDVGLSTTPTVEMEVVSQDAQGGIILTASHNPKEWNALKFLNNKGEFISANDGLSILKTIENKDYQFCNIEHLGHVSKVDDAIHRHIDKILQLETVDPSKILNKKYKVVVDCINSTGGIAMKPLLESLGCECILINEEITDDFAHNPEPLAKNLTQLIEKVQQEKADLGIALDPDVDRLAFVDEKGVYCGEEYTLVMIADWVLSQTPGPTVSNLSSTRALRDVTEARGQQYYASAVGEVNVVEKMRAVDAIIGGEGNGGIIYPTLHAGRDAMVGVALLLTALANYESTLSEYRSRFPNYTIVKDKIQLTPTIDVDQLLDKVHHHFSNMETDTQDGVKIYFDEGWAHLRKSNTEPIIRLYAESKDDQSAASLISKVRSIIQNVMS